MREIIEFEPQGVCCKFMKVELVDDIIKSIDFLGGCSGNLSGIKNLVIGMNINEVKDKLRGIDCNGKGTSCPDQLAQCLEQYINSKSKTHV